MKENTTSKLMYPIFGALLGMLIGFTIFIFSEQIIFLIVCITTGLTLGITLGEKNENQQDKD
jgi:uncharacterized membrane protein